MGCSVGFKYAKNALAAGNPTGRAHDAPQTSYSGADGRGAKGPCPPKP